MIRNILLVAIGGLLGSVARYLAAFLITRSYPSAFPYGTFAVNITGCLVVGVVFGLAERFDWFSPDLRLFLATGFCGGFTTFSSFAYENILLLHDKDYSTFALYSVTSFVLGLLATFIGLSITRV